MRSFLERHSAVIAWAVAPHKDREYGLSLELANAQENITNIEQAARELLSVADQQKRSAIQTTRDRHAQDLLKIRDENARLRRTNRLLVERLQGQGQKAEQWPAEACGNCGQPVAEMMDKHVIGTVTDRTGKFL